MASGADYQVFLSFRGPDTRQGFTDCLYHFLVDAGVRVFRDNDEIRPGEKIEVIFEAINNSIVCIPVFSKGYASSKWCLRELWEMVRLEKTVLPVFFDVSPDDVKLKTPLYRDALYKFRDGTVKENWEMALTKVLEVSGWKANDQGEWALKQVVKFKGWELKDKGYGELCKSIVAEVLEKLNVRDRIVTDYLVGIEDQVESVQKLLDMNAPGVQYVLIHGIGGIGKTTLANVVFNKFKSCFEHYSFISDVRESVQRHGIKHLQKQLLVDTCRISKDFSSSDDGIRAIRELLPNKKVLIVLDDVDKREQIENLIPTSGSLSPGSRVIVTTRDERVVDFRHDLVRKLKMEELDTNRALELFSVHAFSLDFPPLEYLDLSKEVVSLAGRLPLCIEIAGSFVRSKSKKEWNSYITKLSEVPEKKVQEKLMISYNALDIRTRQIFLDIACFFVNKEKINATYMWEACGFHPDSGIEELTSKSMVKVVDGSKLWMHDVMRDLGREVVCQENLVDLGKRSRLWIHEEALGVLEREEGTRKVQALCFSAVNPSPVHFAYESLKKLMNLRFLEWSGHKVLDGKSENIFSKLRWLSWRNCPPNLDAVMLNLANLVILDLSGSKISQNWKGWTQTYMGCNLKVLNLTNCKYLTTTPDLSKFSGLERLILRGCTKLTKIHRSIRMVKRLKHLNLTACSSLRGLPEELCCLKALEEIIISGGMRSFSLPKSIGNLVSLKVLELLNVRLRELPETFSKLKLKRLRLIDSWRMQKFPDSLGDLESLVTLDLTSCNFLCELPNSIGNLKQLKHIGLMGCSSLQGLPEEFCSLYALEEIFMSGAGSDHSFSLPEHIGNLVTLTILNIRNVRITELPVSICELKKLKELSLVNCWGIFKFPDSFGDLESLVILNASNGRDLCELPDSIGNLKQLKMISLFATRIRLLPRTIGMLEQLEDISLSGCNLVREIPPVIGTLSRLIQLDLDQTAIQVLPSLRKLSNLQSLCLDSCNKLLEVSELPPSLTDLTVKSNSLQKVSFEFSTLNRLVCLDWGCSKIGWPWGEQSSVQPHLSKLRIGQWNLTNNNIPQLSTLMKSMSSLAFWNCKFEERFQLLGVGDLKYLSSLSIDSCDCRELNMFCLPESLERLTICDCHLLTLVDVSLLTKLESLHIREGERPTEFLGLAELQKSKLQVYRDDPYVGHSLDPEASSDSGSSSRLYLPDESSDTGDENYEALLLTDEVSSDMEVGSHLYLPDGSSDTEDEYYEASHVTYPSSEIEN